MKKFLLLSLFLVVTLANQAFGSGMVASICDDQTVVLGADNSNMAIISTGVSDGQPPYSYEWSNGAFTSSITVSPTFSTAYSVTIFDSSGDAIALNHTVTVVDARCGSNLEKVTMCHPSSSPHTHCVEKKDVDKKLEEGWSLGDCGLDISRGNCPIPEKLGCDCNDGMVSFSLQYKGAGAAVIAGYAEDDFDTPIEFYTNVQTGDILTFTAAAANFSKLKSKSYVSVNGGSELEVHTSCSQDIQGMEIGDFTVVSFTDVQGYLCEAPSCECLGNAQTLTIQYNGPAVTGIYVYNDIGLNPTAQLATLTNVNPGDVFTVNAATLGLTKLNDYIYLEIPDLGSNAYHINASCSLDILGVFGYFEVLSYLDMADNSCPLPPMNCDCDGGIRAIAFRYTGPSGVTLNVYNDKNEDDLITSFPSAMSGDLYVVDAGQIGEEKFGDFTITGANGAPLTLHTSCSQDVIGSYGDLTITGFVDKEFGNCNVPDYEMPPEPCDCDGGIRAIAFTYTGPSGVTLNIYDDKDGDDLITSFFNVMSGDMFVVDAGLIGKEKFGDFTIEGAGAPLTLHTSCSQDVVGTYGNLSITGFVDKEFGICNVPDYEAPPQPCDCDGGMSVIGVVYTGAGGNVTFYSDGNAILTVAAATGDTIIFAAVDAGLEKFEKNSGIGTPGQAIVEVHTSCSQNILGTFGSITIFGYADADFDNICNIPNIVLPPAPCDCDGGMSAIQFTYKGPSNGTVQVYNDGDLFRTFTGLFTGQVLLIQSRPLAEKLEKDVSIRMAGQANVNLHTSCSQPILGDRGFIEVTGYADKEDNVCNIDGYTPPPLCDCSGGMKKIKIQYLGTTMAQINTYIDGNSNDVIQTFYNITEGDVITIDAAFVGEPKLDKNVTVSIQGSGVEYDLHTSCSQDIAGLTLGDLYVLGHTDGNNMVCELPPIDNGTSSGPRQGQFNGLSYMKAFPNPLVDEVNIYFELPETDQLTMRLYNMQGQLVDVIFDEAVEGQTKQQINFSFKDLSAGVYLVKATTFGGLITVQKLVVTK